MTALYADLGSSCGHDRLTFGCAGCARRRDEAIAAVELAAAPLRKVELRWRVEHDGVIDVEMRVPQSWVDARPGTPEHDAMWQALSDRFNCEIGAALSEAHAQILMSADLYDMAVGDEVPSAPPSDPVQTALDFGAAS